MTKFVLTKEDLDRVAGLPSRDAAKILNVGKTTINEARERARQGLSLRLPTDEDPAVAAEGKPRILALDLETSPNLAHVWGLFKQNVGINQLLESTEVLCWGARWLGEPDVIFSSVHGDGKQLMLEKIHALLNEADAVMGWNSKGFDVKHLNREFLENGMLPPTPFIDMDLMLSVKAAFRFPSNKLDYVAQKLLGQRKVKHSGHELWIRCMAGDEDAWVEMQEYQEQDVNLLIDLYYKLLPWLKGHPNMGLFSGDEAACVNCGSFNLTKNGFAYTGASKFQRYVCADCGKPQRGNKRVDTTTMRSY